jgi:hypothetical protein
LKLPAAHESGQAALKAESAMLEDGLSGERKTAACAERFLSLSLSCAGIGELPPTILHEFIEKTAVRAPGKSIGHRQQKAKIFCNSAGAIDVPGEGETVEHYRQRRQRRLAKQQAEQAKTAQTLPSAQKYASGKAVRPSRLHTSLLREPRMPAPPSFPPVPPEPYFFVINPK